MRTEERESEGQSTDGSEQRTLCVWKSNLNQWVLFRRPNKSRTNEHTKWVIEVWFPLKHFHYPPQNTKQQHEVELFGVLTHELSIYQTLGFHHHVLGLSLTSRQRCVWNQTNRSLVRVRQKDKKKKSYIIILILFTTAIFQLVLWICNCEVYIPKSPLMQDNVADVIKERFPLRTAWARRRTLQ